MDNIWNTLYTKFNSFDENSCKCYDQDISDCLECLSDINRINYYMCQGVAASIMPKTKDKINRIFRNSINDKEIDFSFLFLLFRKYNDWLENETILNMVKRWIGGLDTIPSYCVNNVSITLSEMAISNKCNITRLDILNKLIDICKNSRTYNLSKYIGKLFCGLSIEELEDGCKILSRSTPSVTVYFLSRSDIQEKYLLIGLKSLSKLSKQRDINFKIDFDALKNLGPKSRLEAAKQLMGMCSYSYKRIKRYGGNYYSFKRDIEYDNKYKENIPFKRIPTKEEFEKFLFPCSIKYNSDVVELIDRFKKFSEQQEP